LRLGRYVCCTGLGLKIGIDAQRDTGTATIDDVGVGSRAGGLRFGSTDSDLNAAKSIFGVEDG
jgi:hypothetical protein